MIFLIRACGKRQSSDAVAFVPEGMLEREGCPGRKRAGGTEPGGLGRGRGVKALNTQVRPPPQPGLGLGLPRAGSAPAGCDHVLTGGTRALYFFFLLGISGPFSPRRAQRRRRRRRQQPPGPRACLLPARPPSFPRVLVPPSLPPPRLHWVLAPPV
jgi:hypothetical protein